jgi:hypothetical protein
MKNSGMNNKKKHIGNGGKSFKFFVYDEIYDATRLKNFSLNSKNVTYTTFVLKK